MIPLLIIISYYYLFIFREALQAAESHIAVDRAMIELENDIDDVTGEFVPVLCTLELTRRIYDQGNPNSCEIVVRSNENE